MQAVLRRWEGQLLFSLRNGEVSTPEGVNELSVGRKVVLSLVYLCAIIVNIILVPIIAAWPDLEHKIDDVLTAMQNERRPQPRAEAARAYIAISKR